MLLTGLVLALVGCQSQSPEVLGRAYVAPATLNLRKQLAQKNTAVAVLKHGDRVSIIDVRRRFVKVRTDQGAEGWVDSTELLSPAEMEQIRRERQQAALLPSEGAASAYETLNVHLAPDRRSPAFAQLAEGAQVQVLTHKVAPRVTTARSSSLVIERPPQPSRQHRPEREGKHNLLAPPPPPKPPANWETLSAERIDGSESAAERRSAPALNPVARQVQDVKKPAVLEDWTLIKTKSNQIGWVLSRNLEMSIPDEVAQYAEGKRITSYFSLGTINDEKGVKHDWLWTTASGPISYDFDGWRVFSWNRRRHRFETSYRQRDVEGYFPVHVSPPGSNPAGRTFELITKDDDGKLRRRTFLFDGVHVHLIGKEEYHPDITREPRKPAGIDTNQLQAKVPHPGFFGREWAALKRRFSGTN
ncbi:MAG: SH3 domain-containing protein [Acidobacteriaceae bacterium]|nr:SH3 domain-containing protein [Acidobacteriaceae bacterium]